MMNEKPDLDADDLGVESTIEYVLIGYDDIQEGVQRWKPICFSGD